MLGHHWGLKVWVRTLFAIPEVSFKSRCNDVVMSERVGAGVKTYFKISKASCSFSPHERKTASQSKQDNGFVISAKLGILSQ